MGLSLLFPLGINTFLKKQLLIYHNYGDVLQELWTGNIILNQKTGTVMASAPSGTVLERTISRKEVFQPHLPVRLPCYDLALVTDLALGRSLR